MYALNLGNDNRILSACIVLSVGNYGGMPVVSELPEGDVSDYKYINNEYVYEPLAKPEPAPTLTERVEQTEADIEFIAMMTGVDMEV